MVQKKVRGDHELEEKNDDGTYVFVRQEDRSFWLKTAYTIDKYKILWIPLFALLTALGFDFQTPRAAKAQLQVQIDSLKLELSSATVERREIGRKVDILLKVPCLDKNRNARELMLIGVNCDGYADR